MPITIALLSSIHEVISPPTTCRFRSGAVCDDSNEGCCRSCQFAASGTVCRSSTGSCDPAETCSGNDGNCPADETAEDGTGCGNGLECASGQCTSRDQQCKTLMAAYSANNDTYACNSRTCSVSCASPEFGPNVCYSMQQNFLDGTPCSGGGRCNNVSFHSPSLLTSYLRFTGRVFRQLGWR